ncbi:hypothetical protein TELCIR_11841 [Teladorsagia circumcincta]|uniref:Uncharacterized protein n=1 Tax=Teladorsagia circumcincta TaxID=45464 RepID=A0A2G9U8C6_TELCI|nr:hypothetical protein TELCIR_11841 [Teladorsagia circumcincta]
MKFPRSPVDSGEDWATAELRRQLRMKIDDGGHWRIRHHVVEREVVEGGIPRTAKDEHVVKNASAERMKIHGKLRCKIKMKSVETEAYAFVIYPPYNSLIGLEWIRANEEMRCHLEMMTAEVK